MLATNHCLLRAVKSCVLRIHNTYVHVAPGEGQRMRGRGEGMIGGEVRLVPLALPHV
jgi:hypothetical protein